MPPIVSRSFSHMGKDGWLQYGEIFGMQWSRNQCNSIRYIDLGKAKLISTVRANKMLCKKCCFESCSSYVHAACKDKTFWTCHQITRNNALNVMRSMPKLVVRVMQNLLCSGKMKQRNKLNTVSHMGGKCVANLMSSALMWKEAAEEKKITNVPWCQRSVAEELKISIIVLKTKLMIYLYFKLKWNILIILSWLFQSSALSHPILLLPHTMKFYGIQKDVS